MGKFKCSICGYIYDEAFGIPGQGIKPGTKWEDVPKDWVCPLCGASKSDFTELTTNSQTPLQTVKKREDDLSEMRELSLPELSALCSNLAKGFEKQYRTEEAELFMKLSDYYKSKVSIVDKKQFVDLNVLIEQDLNSVYIEANAVAANIADRGALRSLTWGEKVTRIHNSLLSRYEKEQNAMLENTNVFICEICGFIYIGNEAPDICPVCKVPKLKITQVQRG